MITETERLIISDLSPSLLEDYCAIVCDPSTGAFDEEFPKTRDEAKTELEDSCIPRPTPLGVWSEYGVFEKEGRRLIGLVCHYDVMQSGLHLSKIGFHFNPQFRGKGFAVEAVRAFCAWLLESGSGGIVAVADRNNKRSIGLLVKLGFQIENSFMEHMESEVCYCSPECLKMQKDRSQKTEARREKKGP